MSAGHCNSGRPVPEIRYSSELLTGNAIVRFVQGRGMLRRRTLLFFAASVVACRSSPTAPSANLRSIDVNGAARAYALHVPANFQANAGALVIALHGAGDDGPSFERRTNLSALADQAGFAVAYPNGLFNSRVGATDWELFGSDFADDVGFLRQLVTAVSVEIRSDPNRTFIAGFSDGGRLAHRAAVELSDRIAAIGVVGGSLFQGPVQVPPARAPVSVLILHGDADVYCGAPLDASQDQTFDYWAGSPGDGCASIEPASPLCDSQGIDTAVVDKVARSCRAGTEVRIYKLIGGRHAWYAGLLNMPGQVPFNPDLDATTGITTNDVIWNFFVAHPKR